MKLVTAFLLSLVAMAASQTALDEFASGNHAFTAALYKEVLQKKPNENFVFSPLSIEIIMALLRAGAKGETESELTKGLRLPSQPKTEEALKQLLPSLKSNSDDLKLQSANKMYLGKRFEILNSFKKIATELFEAGAENVDFSQSEQAAGIINQWVEEQTNHKIKNLIKPEMLDALTRLVLVNALYFKGKWETPFEDYLTKKEKFYTTKTQSKDVDMMHVEDSFKYYECTKCNAKFLELPYVGGEVTMTVVLPNEIEGLGALENNIACALEPKNLTYERVAVSFPRFLVESDVELKPMLQNLGINIAFTDFANLSGISQEPLKVDDVIQKAFINVTESGTEAAAATAVLTTDRIASMDQPKLFIVDHPFEFFIKKNGVILFLGRFVV